MASSPWSVTDDDLLRELARSGIGIIEIAAHLDRTKSAVRVRVERLNIPIARQRNPMQLGKPSKGANRRIQRDL
jgi:hypothetical protein